MPSLPTGYPNFDLPARHDMGLQPLDRHPRSSKWSPVNRSTSTRRTTARSTRHEGYELLRDRLRPKITGGRTLPERPEDRSRSGDERVTRRAKWESGGGGMVSTIGDYARFTQMLLNGDALDGKRYLSPKTVAYMGSNHIGPGSGVTPGPYYLPGPGFGFGLGVRRSDRSRCQSDRGIGRRDELVRRGGTTFWIDPKENMFVIFMARTVSQRQRLRIALKNVVYGAFDK
jgi:CubicO group peptidase (beta-lactamase class C family)